MDWDWKLLFLPKWPQLGFDEIKKRSRLLVVDDHEFAYEVLFKQDGYSIERWPDIERISDIEGGRFDLVLLDMQGIGSQQSAQQGFGVLKHLKERTPSLTVVAYSNADWGLQYQEFFNRADAVLPKSADYVEFKRKVDDLLTRRFSMGFYLGRIADALQESTADQSKVERLAKRAILSGRVGPLRDHLGTLGVGAAQIDRVISIVNVAVGVVQLWAAK